MAHLARRATLCFALTLAVSAVPVVRPARADSTSFMRDSVALPHPTLGASAVWGDGRAYVFGGEAYNRGGASADILSFDPATGGVETVGWPPALMAGLWF